MVISICIRPNFTRRQRSVIFPEVVRGLPSTSSQTSSRNPVVSTTSVSPSQYPAEYPYHQGVGLLLGSGRPSVRICRTLPFASYRMTISRWVWTIFRGCGCMWSWVRPSGRHFASGLSLLLSPFLCARICVAQGVKGRPSLNPAPMLKNCATGGSPGEEGTAKGKGAVPLNDSPPRPAAVRAGSHKPEKSGLPSAVRGGGAARSILPSFVLGPGVGYPGHCANIVIALVARAASTVAAVLRILICVLLFANAGLHEVITLT